MLITKNCLQFRVLKNVRAEYQLGEKREVVSAAFRQINVQRLLVEKADQFCTIKCGGVFKVKLAVEKKMTTIQIKSFLEKQQRVFRRDRIPINPALYGAAKYFEKCAAGTPTP